MTFNADIIDPLYFPARTKGEYGDVSPGEITRDGTE